MDLSAKIQFRASDIQPKRNAAARLILLIDIMKFLVRNVVYGLYIILAEQLPFNYAINTN